VFSLVQVLVIRIPAVRKFCKIPLLVNHKANSHVHEQSVPKQSFVEGFRESTTSLCFSHLLLNLSYHVIWNFVCHIYMSQLIIIMIITITDLYSAFRSEDTEALDAAQED